MVVLGGFIMKSIVCVAMALGLVACGSSSNGYNGAGGSMSGLGGGTTLGGGGATGAGGAPGAACHAAGTLQVSASGTAAYVIDGASNPALTFCRGQTYVFTLNAAGHPFYIKTVQGVGTSNAYDSGVTGNGTDVGNVTFTVAADAPATLFYDCSIHPAMTGTIHIVD
jgi:hypothetical protein